jgi:YD repeat-containing protein
MYVYSAGQVVAAIDPNGNVTQFSYANDDLISVTDPLGRTATRFSDGAGRVIASVSPLDEMTRTEYKALNLITKSRTQLPRSPLSPTTRMGIR